MVDVETAIANLAGELAADRHQHQHAAAVDGHVRRHPLVVAVHADRLRAAVRAGYRPVRRPGP
jgi:hypothetical protein